MLPSGVQSQRLSARMGRALVNLITVIFAAGWLSIIVWTIVVSLRPEADPLSRGDVWFGSSITFSNYARAWSLAPFGRYYINTIVIVLMILGVQLVTITLAGFAFAYYRFLGKRVLFFFILLQMMIPPRHCWPPILPQSARWACSTRGWRLPFRISVQRSARSSCARHSWAFRATW